MRIAYITMQWPSASETFAARDILALHEAGHDVSVVALRPEPANAVRLKAAQLAGNLPSLSFSLGAALKGIGLALANAGLTFSFVKEVVTKETGNTNKIKLLALIPSFFWCVDKIRSLNPDIVHLFWGHYPSAVGYMLGKMNASLPITMFLGAYDLEANVCLSRWMAERAGAVFTHAHANLPALTARGFPSEKIRVVRRGIDLASMRVASHAKRDPHRISFIGRMVPEKGGAMALQAFASILKKFPDASLDMIGDGPELGNLKAQAQRLGITDRVAFHGYLPPAEVYKKLYGSGVFILPSTSPGERLPNVIKEAMYAGAVPVTGRTPGIDELIANDINGIILDNLSPGTIADAVGGLWMHYSPAMQHAGTAAIERDFDVRRNMQAYVDTWQEILKG